MNVSKKSGSNGREGVSRCVYSSPGRRSCSDAGNEKDGPAASMAEAGSGAGRPRSVAADERRPFPPAACVARLNICGIRPREREEDELPSGGWMD